MEIPGYEIIEAFGATTHAKLWRLDKAGKEFVAKVLPLSNPARWQEARFEDVVKGLSANSPVSDLVRLTDDQIAVISPLRRGLTLALARETGALTSRSSRLEVLRGVGQEILELHEKSIAHGDIAPSNIILGRGGRIWLIDFEMDQNATGTVGFCDPNLPVPSIENDCVALWGLAKYLDIAIPTPPGTAAKFLELLENLAQGESVLALPSQAPPSIAAQLRAASATQVAVSNETKKHSRRNKKLTFAGLTVALVLLGGGLFSYFQPSPQEVDWVSRFEALVAQRDEALVNGSVDGLAAIYTPTSPGKQADVQKLSDLLQRGWQVEKAKTLVRVEDVLVQKDQVVIEAFLTQQSYQICHRESCRELGPFPKRFSQVLLDAGSGKVVEIKTGVASQQPATPESAKN